MAYIGVDIGTHFTKLASLSLQSGQHVLEHAFIIVTPQKQISAQTGQISSIDYETLALNIKKLISEYNINITGLALTIPGQQSNTLIFNMPKMSRQELSTAVVQEARRRIIPAPSPDAVFDHIIIGEKVTSGVVRQEILIVGTEKKNIDNFLEFLKNLNFRAETITITSFALSQVLYKNETIEKNEAIAVLDIGANMSSMTIVKNNTPCFYRNVFIGCSDIITTIAKGLSIEEAMAYNVLLYHGIPAVVLPKDPNERVKITEDIMQKKYEMMMAGIEQKLPEDANPTELKITLEPAMDRLMGEVRRSLAYYKENSGGGRVDRLFITGGGAQIKGLLAEMSRDFGGEMKALDPAKNIKIQENKATDAVKGKINILAPAIGLGLELSNRSYRSHINLLPLEIQRQDIVAKQKFYAIIGMIVLVILWIGGLVFLELNIRSLKQVSLRKDITLAQLDPLFKKFEALSKIEKTVKDKNELLAQLNTAAPDWPKTLITLSRITPQDVLLTKFDVKKIKQAGQTMAARSPAKKKGRGKSASSWSVTISGQIVSSYETALKTLNSFAANLEASEYFEDMSLEPLPMEKVVYKMGENKAELTQEKNRVFTINGFISLENEKPLKKKK